MKRNVFIIVVVFTISFAAYICVKMLSAVDTSAAVVDASAAAVDKSGTAYLAQNATRAGVKTTASGLQYRVITAGSGAMPTMNSRVRVHYSGRLVDGTEFDSSYKRDTPASFGVTQVIAGWTEGLQLMKVGGKIELTIPAALAYGPGGTRGIPPESVLIFEIELLDVQ